MAQQEAKKNGGSKLSRSETVTVRLDPKLRYLAELGSRKLRRTVSSYIEWAIEESLARVYLDEHGHQNIYDFSNRLWDVDESDRFAKLAFYFPDLLTHHEQVLWKLVRENGFLWKGRNDDEGSWYWEIREEKLVMERLREYWVEFNQVANGEADKSILPKWTTSNKPFKVEDLEDDIPF